MESHQPKPQAPPAALQQQLYAVSQLEANKFMTTTRYLYDVTKTCYEQCVIDFQTRDIGPLEKECGLACLKKHMTIYKDLVQ